MLPNPKPPYEIHICGAAPELCRSQVAALKLRGHSADVVASTARHIKTRTLIQTDYLGCEATLAKRLRGNNAIAP